MRFVVIVMVVLLLENEFFLVCVCAVVVMVQVGVLPTCCVEQKRQSSTSRIWQQLTLLLPM
jgi:hypothetical protein